MALQILQTNDDLNAGREKINANFSELVASPTSWTPVLAGSAVAGTHTYSTQTGGYVAIGPLVVAFFNIVLTAKDPAMSGSVQVQGLPAAAIAGGDGGVVPSRFANVDVPAGTVQLTGFVSPSSPRLALRTQADNGAETLLSSDAIRSTTSIAGTIIYFRSY